MAHKPASRKLILLGLLLYLITVLGGATAAAQSGLLLTLTRIDSQAFPQVSAYVTVSDQNSLPVTGLTVNDFLAFEDELGVPADRIRVQPAVIRGVGLVLAIDRSTPAANLEQVKTAANALIDTLQPEDKMALFAFDNKVELLVDFTNNTQVLKQAVDALAEQGDYTALNEVIFEAARLTENLAINRRAVIIIPDIKNNIDSLPRQTAQQKITDLGVPLYLLSFPAKAAPNDFDPLVAPLTGASVHFLPAAEQLTPRLLEIAGFLRQGYRLDYTSPLHPDNAAHKLTVGVTHQNLAGEANGRFVAVSNEVSITLPFLTNEQRVGGIVPVEASVMAHSPIASVEFFLDDQPLETLLKAPYQFDWNASGTPPGRYTLTAKAIDSAGNLGQTAVNLAVIPPLVVTASAGVSELQVGDTAAIGAKIETLARIATVELLLDGTVIKQGTAPPFDFSFDTATYTAGTHTITVRATDTLGNYADDSLTMNFLAPPPPPPSPWSRWLRLLAVIILIGLALLFLLVLLLLALYRKPHTQRRPVEIVNLGNARSRFKLLAEDPAGALEFAFTLNGVLLPVEEEPELQPALPSRQLQPTEPMHGSQPGTAQAAAKPAKAPAKKSDMKQMLGLGQVILSLLRGVAPFLPQSMRGSVLQTTSQVGRVQSQAGRAQSLAGQAGKLAPAGGVKAPRPAVQRITAAPDESPYVPSNVSATVTTPMPGPQVAVNPWTWTPYLLPGQRLAMELLLTPVKPNLSREYIFSITSQLAEPVEGPPQTEAGQIFIRGRSLFSRIFPVFAFLIVATLVILLTTLISWWLIIAPNIFDFSPLWDILW
jgi:hypothetical protein